VDGLASLAILPGGKCRTGERERRNGERAAQCVCGESHIAFVSGNILRSVHQFFIRSWRRLSKTIASETIFFEKVVKNFLSIYAVCAYFVWFLL
jgi:hypothetical protein